MGYTSGVAEKLYNGFVEGTYLVEDKFENVSREEALKLFSDYYGEPYDTEEYLANTEDYVYIDDYEMFFDDSTKTGTVYSSSFSYVNSLAEGGYAYTLTPEAQERFEEGLDVEEDDFTSIRLAVAGERLGDISVWYDIVKEAVGGRDFEERSVSQYNGDIYDNLEEFKHYIIDEINQQN